MVANRGEIAIRVLRAGSELSLRTVAVYTYEDRYSLHRYKADESYQIGAEDDPLKPYLDIEEIIRVAKKNGVDAIHPGYGFLSENVEFARRCREEDIVFIGPDSEIMQQLGNKISAKKVARKADVPVIEGAEVNADDIKTAQKEAETIGYPVIIKAASGGGGRGMRVVENEKQLKNSLGEAQSEAGKAFGDETVFLEKYIVSPKHVEVQILGDRQGNIVHLHERDCSIQRRFQKVIEIAPCPSLSDNAKQKLFKHALGIARAVKYNNAGTVEFLVDADENIYFIEVNPRIQVEHTITEEITGIDIVRAQILIAQGCSLNDKALLIGNQESITTNGYAIQCRITTEDPEDNFSPDYGTIIAYRSAGGFGIRLDAGNCYRGVTISPFFDSLLVKVSSRGQTLPDAAQRLHRALREFRIRGVKTNIGFLENVITHPKFFNGTATVRFIDDNPKLFDIPTKRDRGTRLLNYLADVGVNGNPDIKFTDERKNSNLRTPKVPEFDKAAAYPKGTKDKLNELGRDKFIEWLKDQKGIQYTDTTFRDAHQSLLATRMRTKDLMAVAEPFAKHHPEVFSMEVWGGATFDVCLRFLHEDPWKRLQLIREAVPNIMLQMLLRGSNAVGYKAYPDNLIKEFIIKAAENGIDIFRIFDSLNWVEAMKVSINTVREQTDALAEASICYTGDITDPDEDKYTTQYYVDLARELEDEGAHILAIKDMAGLLKPYAAEKLIPELKEAVDIPIHLHTHDTSSIQPATYLKAIEAGVDVVDVAVSSMSGLTSQPNFNSLVASLKGHERETAVDLQSLNKFATYWEDVREYYYPFETELKAGTAEIYEHEIPGGQYSNLRPQARGLGLEDKFQQIKKNYQEVDDLLGRLIKVTPSSKVVGDMAMFMTSNDLTINDIIENGQELSFPDSVISLFKGELGQPYQGLPENLYPLILKNREPFTERPNAHLEPVDFEAEFANFQEEFKNHNSFLDFLSYKLYPKVFKDFHEKWVKYGDVRQLPTKPFFFGLDPDQEIIASIGRGKNLLIKMLYISKPDDEGYRSVNFELNGQIRKIYTRDLSADTNKTVNPKAEGKHQIGAPLQGRIFEIHVEKGDSVSQGDVLFVIEAMKMETSVEAPFDGTIEKVQLGDGDLVDQNDLVVAFEE